MLACVLVGIVPPDKALYELVRREVTSVANSRPDPCEEEEEEESAVKWRDCYSLVYEDSENNDGKNTLLMAATTSAPPEAVVAAVIQAASSAVVGGRCSNTSNPANAETMDSFSCELWASAPAPLPLCPLDGYNLLVTENDKDDAETSWEERAATTMREWGIVVQPHALLMDEDSATTIAIIAELRKHVDAAIRNVEESLALHRPEITIGLDDFLFNEIASRNKHRFDLRLTDTSAVGEIVERVLLGRPSVKAFVQRVLGNCSSINEIDWDISVVYSRSGAGKQGWHADGDHQPGATDAGWDDSDECLAAPYAICLFLPLIDLNDDVGFTQFWPGSHRQRNLIGFGRVAELTGATFDGKVRAGDGVWYDYRLLHQGMPNQSNNVLRPVLQVIFKKKWYIEKANYGVESIIPKEQEEARDSKGRVPRE